MSKLEKWFRTQERKFEEFWDMFHDEHRDYQLSCVSCNESFGVSDLEDFLELGKHNPITCSVNIDGLFIWFRGTEEQVLKRLKKDFAIVTTSKRKKKVV